METKTTHIPVNVVESLPDFSGLAKLPPPDGISLKELMLEFFPKTVLGSTLRALFRDPKIEPWPLNNVGDEEYFGHILSIGVSQDDPSGQEDTFSPFIVCLGRDGLLRTYALPADEELMFKLLKQVEINVQCVIQSDYVGSRVYIQKTESGYLVEEP